MPEQPMAIPKEIRGQKYISLTTFRKSGAAVNTPLWFAEQGEKLYVKTRNDSGKYKRIRNNPQVKVAPCTMRGKIIGPEFSATARLLPPAQWPEATKAMNRKYWLSRLPFWSKNNEFVEIEIAG
jgi:PPOX class probable F420-dependent enzyme